MPSWWRLHDRRDGLLSRQLHAANPTVVLTPRNVVGLLAFLICVDMTQVLGVLCYQLFLGTYFPWHLYPLMLNRAVELLALLCSEGHVSSVYSVAQVFLSLLSMVICIQKQPCGKFNCVAALVLYGVLLTYQIFVAVMVVKIASIPIIGDDERHGNAIWLEESEGQNTGAGTASNSMFDEQDIMKDYNDVIIAVEQPDGEKFAIARLLKDVAIVAPISDEGSSHPKDKWNAPAPPKEKTRCESAQESWVSCNNQNPLEKSEVSASKLEDLHSDDVAPKMATTRTPACGHPKNEEQSGTEDQVLEMDQDDVMMKAKTGLKIEEELASNVFLESLTTEIVSFFEDKASQDELELHKEHSDTQS